MTNSQWTRLINNFINKPLTPVPNLKIKKELHDLGEIFQSKIDSKVFEILNTNGF